MSHKIKICAAAVLATAAVGGGVAAQSASAAPTLYAKHVKSNVENVRVFKTASGDAYYDKVGACFSFSTDRKDGERYHFYFNGNEAWITASSDYVAPGSC